MFVSICAYMSAIACMDVYANTHAYISALAGVYVWVGELDCRPRRVYAYVSAIEYIDMYVHSIVYV